MSRKLFNLLNDKYLIVLLDPRGGEKTYISMYKNVKEHLKADLAICTTEDMYDDKILFLKNLIING